MLSTHGRVRGRDEAVRMHVAAASEAVLRPV